MQTVIWNQCRSALTCPCSNEKAKQWEDDYIGVSQQTNHASYMADGIMHEDDDRLGVAFSFDLYCSGEVDDLQRSIQFSTQSENGETADFRFTICVQDNDEDEESLILQAMSSWKWD